MRKTIIFAMSMILFCSVGTFGQESKKMAAIKEPKKTYKPKSEDVGSMDGILKAVYDVISGEANQKRDWDRFRSLFHKDARLIPTGINPSTGITQARAFTPDEYIERSEPFMMKNGFFEKEIARRVEKFGNIVHVFSTYAGRYKAGDVKPFLRGINSFQLLFDGKRWWIVNIYWQAESKDNPLTEEFLKNK